MFTASKITLKHAKLSVRHYVLRVLCTRRIQRTLNEHVKSRHYILIYVQQDATLHSLFYLEIALRVSGGTTTHHQERKQLYLQHLVFITLLLLPAASGR